MGKSTAGIIVITVIASFTGGFLLANALNRSELVSLRTENDRLKTEAGTAKTDRAEVSLTDEEIRAKIAQADSSPDNFGFQKNLGIGLYRYGVMKKDAGLIAESARLLARAHQLDPKDHDVLLGLGHSNYDIGYYKKENTGFERAREFYGKALALKPRDIETQTEIAMTWFILDPPNYEKAIAEFQKSLQIDPGHQKTLQFLAESYAKTNKVEDAEKTLAKLREVNSANPYIPEITSMISQARNGQTK